MDANIKLRAKEGDKVEDASAYRRLIGRLMYLTIFRPDIIFAVTKLAQFMSNPRVQHLNAVHQILRYLKAAPGQDWGSCLDTKRSTTGYCTFFEDFLISWKSKKQLVMSRSSIKAEYWTLANAAYEVV
ncbi:uncharacterized mitochondrial protein AtMg00810-like [Arachis hypogaea]|uniref:uncharacterized mitochondrial protein AtMg00810-like n=1 Tax=Arachis hypogaea TaxID=3818 RepID=UPI000DECE2C4|nr:uncharacterized protein LOC112705000 [Arachis hypogaea]